MIEQNIIFKNLIKQLQQVPYLASKNIYAIIEYFLKSDTAKIQQLCQALLTAKEYIIPCEYCFSWKEKETSCFFCDGTQRDKTIICVVESSQELMAIEKTGGYKGIYHVLGGAICPLEGIDPENLTINQLFERITSDVHEIILATNQTPEGEATAAYIAHSLKNKNVIISCLARGIPVGSSLMFMDRITIHKALADRRLF